MSGNRLDGDLGLTDGGLVNLRLSRIHDHGVANPSRGVITVGRGDGNFFATGECLAITERYGNLPVAGLFFSNGCGVFAAVNADGDDVAGDETLVFYRTNIDTAVADGGLVNDGFCDRHGDRVAIDRCIGACCRIRDGEFFTTS